MLRSFAPLAIKSVEQFGWQPKFREREICSSEIQSSDEGVYSINFEANWRPSWKDYSKLGVCKQIILQGFRMQS